MVPLLPRSLNALAWGSGGAVLRSAMQLGAQVLLARLLGPEQYGIFAIGAIVVGFSNFLSDVGLAYGLIQKSKVEADDIRFVLGWQCVLGLMVALGLVVASNSIATYFGEPRAQAVLSLLALVCMLNALAAPSLNLLKRNFDFKHIQLSHAASYFVGFYAIGIPLAVLGWQVHALVAAWLVQAALMLILLYRGTRHPLRPLLWYEQASVQWRYAVSVLGTNLLNWMVSNVDRVIVARMFASQEVGLYTTSFNLIFAPGSALVGAVQPVMFAASSRLTSQRSGLRQAYLGALGIACSVGTAFFGVIAVLATPIVELLLGSRWMGAASLSIPFALAMPLYLMVGISTPVLWTRDRVTREFKLQLPTLMIGAVACSISAMYSLQAVAWTVLAVYALRASLLASAAARVCGLTIPVVAAMVLPSLGWSACTMVVAALVQTVLGGLHAAVQVGVAVPAAALLWLLLPRILPGFAAPDVRQALNQVISRLPPRLASALCHLSPRTENHD